MAFYGKTADQLVGDDKTMISNLVVLLGAAAGAAAGGDGQALASGGNAARVEVENNSLSMDETKARDKELAACTTAECKQAVRAKYFDLYFSNEDKAEKCASAAQCMSVYHELQAEQKEYAEREQELRNNFSNLNDEEKKELFALQKVIQNYDGTKNAALHYATRYAGDGSPISEVDKAILAAGVGGIGNGGNKSNSNKYSGELVKVNKPDAAADALAQRIGGESRVRFSNDGREFDTISGEYIAQTKPALQQVNKSVRDQMKATFEAAKETNRSVYYHFEGQPSPSVINKLNEYSTRYGVKVVIDTKPLNP